MIVYRVETVERMAHCGVGYGAYRAPHKKVPPADVLLADFCCDNSKHPTPDVDGMLCTLWARLSPDEKTQQVFCFKSYNQLKNWFYICDEAVKKASEMPEFHIGVYYVPDEFYNEGHLQAIANKCFMSLIGSYPIGSDIPDIDPEMIPDD